MFIIYTYWCTQTILCSTPPLLLTPIGVHKPYSAVPHLYYLHLLVYTNHILQYPTFIIYTYWCTQTILCSTPPLLFTPIGVHKPYSAVPHLHYLHLLVYTNHILQYPTFIIYTYWCTQTIFCSTPPSLFTPIDVHKPYSAVPHLHYLHLLVYTNHILQYPTFIIYTYWCTQTIFCSTPPLLFTPIGVHKPYSAVPHLYYLHLLMYTNHILQYPTFIIYTY